MLSGLARQDHHAGHRWLVAVIATLATKQGKDVLGTRQGELLSTLRWLRRCSAGSNFVTLHKHLNQFYSMYIFCLMKEVCDF